MSKLLYIFNTKLYTNSFYYLNCQWLYNYTSNVKQKYHTKYVNNKFKKYLIMQMF